MLHLSPIAFSALLLALVVVLLLIVVVLLLVVAALVVAAGEAVTARRNARTSASARFNMVIVSRTAVARAYCAS